MTIPTIIPARPADLPTIHTMIRALSAFHGDTAQITIAHLQDVFFGASPQAIALIARMGKDIVGYAGLTQTIVIHEGTQSLDIQHLFVSETHRAKGIGTALIRAAQQHAHSCGATRLTIGTDPRNAAAIRAYRAMPMLTEKTNGGPQFSVDLNH